MPPRGAIAGKAIQEQQAMIAGLVDENATLRSRLDDSLATVETRLAALEG